MADDASLTRWAFRPRFCETDLMGIVHHANYLVYFEAARVEWLRRRGVSFAEWARRGINVPVVEVAVSYRSAAYFDDDLVIEARLSEVRSASIRFAYRLLRGETLLADGNTRLAWTNAERRLERIPEDIRKTLASPES
ncbi:MAG: thioesterase family protein, partial [Polyangiaceae bacterium]